MANRKKTRKKRKPSHPLPKVGTPKDDAYRVKHSREDVIDFGLAPAKRGPLNWIIAVVVILLIAGGIVGLIALT